jgi:hypothetical protein
MRHRLSVNALRELDLYFAEATIPAVAVLNRGKSRRLLVTGAATLNMALKPTVRQASHFL